MKRFIEGIDRSQSTLFPDRLEDYIAEDNPVRVIDVFVEALDLRGLGFESVDPSATGRPSYHPSVLLKLYIYGYLNRVQSSRRVEREAQRNVEVMWLTRQLMPDHKTISDFRKNNGKAIVGVCREFVGVCRRLELFSQALVAIDGSKFKAVNNRDNNFTEAKMKKRLERVEKSIARYLSELDKADRAEPAVAEAKVERLQEKLETLKDEMARLKVLDKRMQAAPDKQLSLTDPDARSMATSGKGSGMVGYNVQTAVESKNHLIVAHEVTNVGNDRAQLVPMAERARGAMDMEELSAVADRGYFSGTQIVDCEEAGITTFVPKPLTSSGRKTGRFTKQDFVYEPEHDGYRCPAGEHLTQRFSTVEKGLTLNVYSASVFTCRGCAMKARCTGGTHQRRIRRWEREDIVDAMLARLDEDPEKMQLRRQTVEHPFGTLKAWMGATHFLTKTLPRVSTEMSLHVLAYNMKRVMNLLGVGVLMEAMRA
jgi:transposase